ncbi:MAG: DNA gyrase subunit B, partial [uncultured bacterium]
MHGVGVSVVNALSSNLKAEVYRDGKVYYQEYSRGEALCDIKQTGKSDRTGTKISFVPDPDIFDSVEFSYDTIMNRMRQQAYLTKGVSIWVVDEKEDRKHQFHFEGGIKSYVRHLNKNRDSIGNEIVYIEREVPEGVIEISLQYTQAFQETVYTFANNIHTIEGGMHLTGFRSALTRVINTYARKNELIKEKEDNLTSDDVREGLTAVVSVKLADPQFEGQTKSKLGNAEMRTAVETVFGEAFMEFLNE